MNARLPDQLTRPGLAAYVAGFAIASTLPLTELVVAHRAKVSTAMPTNPRNHAQNGVGGMITNQRKLRSTDHLRDQAAQREPACPQY